MHEAILYKKLNNNKVDQIHPVEMKILQLCENVTRKDLKRLREDSVEQVKNSTSLADVLENILNTGPSFYELGINSLFSGALIGTMHCDERVQEMMESLAKNIAEDEEIEDEAKAKILLYLAEAVGSLSEDDE